MDAPDDDAGAPPEWLEAPLPVPDDEAGDADPWDASEPVHASVPALASWRDETPPELVTTATGRELRVLGGGGLATPVDRLMADLTKRGKGIADGWEAGGTGLERLEKIRELPPMPMPAHWPAMAGLVEIFPGEILSVIGATGAGKTSWAIDVALAYVAETQGTVLWLAKELNALQVDLRIAAKVLGRPWSEVRRSIDPALVRSAYPVRGRLAYPQRKRSLDEQMIGLALGIEAAKRASGGRRPLVIIDTIQLMGRGEGKEMRGSVALAVERGRELIEAQDCYGLFLSQSSRAGQVALRGATQYDDVRDAVGLGAESSDLENASAGVIGLQVMPADEHGVSPAIGLVAKLRNAPSGRMIGMQFDGGRGGRWTELDYVPATKAEVAEVRAKERKQGREMDASTAQQAANVARHGQARDRARLAVVDVLAKSGPQTVRSLKVLARVGYTILREVLNDLDQRGGVRLRPDGRYEVIL